MTMKLGDDSTRNRRSTVPAESTPLDAKPKRLGIEAAHVERGKVARVALDAASPDIGPGEAILHEFIGHQTALGLAVLDAQAEVAARLVYLLDQPADLVKVAKALRELTTISNAIGRRVEGALATASSLRAQRRLWKLGHS